MSLLPNFGNFLTNKRNCPMLFGVINYQFTVLRHEQKFEPYCSYKNQCNSKKLKQPKDIIEGYNKI